MKRIFSLLLFLLTIVAGSEAQVSGIEAGKTYRIALASKPKKSLFVKDSAPDNMKTVVMWTETNVPSQQWTAEVDDQGRYAFKNVYTGKYLNYTGGSLCQYTGRSWWDVDAVEDGDNAFYIHKNARYLHAKETTDGSVPTMDDTLEAWILEEVEPQPALNDSVRRRMADGYLQQFLQDKGSGYRTFCNGGWGESETLETILDMYEATGDRHYLSIYESCYSYFRYHVGGTWTGGTIVGGYNWFGYSYNDDVMWHIIGAARAYLLTGNTLYLNDAKNNFDLIWNRAYLGYVGLLRWAEQNGDRNSANSCVNGPAEVAACYIALGTGDETYFEKAKELYQNQRTYLANMSTGQVYDNVIFNPETCEVVERNSWASTYNQGTMLGAAVLLFQHYGDAQYKNDADKIISYSRTNLCDNNGIIKVCQSVDGDFQGFKGILMRYVGLYVRHFGNETYDKWMKDNAMRAFSNLNSKGFGHSAWLTKASEDFTFGSGDDMKTYNNSPFGGSTSLSAAFGNRCDSYTATANEDGTFTINVDQKGYYRLDISYQSASSETVYLTVNDGDAITRNYATTGDYTGVRAYYVAMREGDNTIALTADSNGQLPTISKVDVHYLAPIFSTLEAEHAESHGQTSIFNDADASCGRYMGRIGNGSSNYITFYYDADEGGEYDLGITFFGGAQRQMYIRVNNGSKNSQVFESTGSSKASSAITKIIRVTLKSGTNTITMGNDNMWGPYVDKIELNKADESGIEQVSHEEECDINGQAVYNVQGMRVTSTNASRKGIYIVGKKKVLLGI